MKTAVFTIASRNYFAFVRTLMDSLEQTNAAWDRYVAVADQITPDFEQFTRNFQLISLEQLKLPDWKKMMFRYSIMEFNTDVKPYVFTMLFEKMGYDRVIYLDPDIYVYQPMHEVEKALENGADFVLTPHLTGMWDEDGKQPDEPAIMRSGVYNLGFLALNNCADTREMVHWWEKKLEYQCAVDIEHGIFVDQKWIDLVPGRYDHVCILRHNGYNTAYWNLSHRKITKEDETFFCNGQRLVFFHFSGFHPKKKNKISKHSDRFTMDEIGEAKALFEDYAKKVCSNEFEKWEKYHYAYAVFEDGRKVLDLFRTAYRKNITLQAKCGMNPFARSDIFYELHRQEMIEFILKYIWESRTDLQAAFPNGLTEDYVNWFKRCAEEDYGIPREYLEDASIHQKKREEQSADLRFRIKNQLFETLPRPVWKLGRNLYRSVRPRQDRNSSQPVQPIGTGIIEVSNQRTKSIAELKNGVNLVGYIRSEHGIGETCRMTARCLEYSGMKWQAYDYEVGNISRQNERSWDEKIADHIDYKVSVFCINADQMNTAKENTPKEAWAGYKIGIWFWELMEFPDQWCGAFKLIDEIWAPTHFIEEALSKKATCPVIYMPLGIEFENEKRQYERSYFGLPSDCFLFLNMFDSLSFQSRKNPKAAIDAFQKAFSPDDSTVGMVIKINNQSPDSQEMRDLRELKGNYENIYFIAKTFSREEINGLIRVCDVAVSLHKSEGLGLLCQEAMYFGKPVIATNWSGNTDFMNKENSCLVGYKLEQIGEDVGPYQFWQRWAQADVVEAAAYMGRLKEDQEYYSRIAKRAYLTMKEEYSPAVCGLKMKRRIEEVLEALRL